jgi:hypothetical protein
MPPKEVLQDIAARTRPASLPRSLSLFSLIAFHTFPSVIFTYLHTSPLPSPSFTSEWS